MEISLFVLAVSLMFSGAKGASKSMSCSMVNGVYTCDERVSDGNTAMSSSSAQSGPGFTYQNTFAGAGNPGQIEYNQQTLTNGVPSGGQAAGGAFGSPGFTYSSSSSSSGGGASYLGTVPPFGGFGFPMFPPYPGAGAGAFAGAGVPPPPPAEGFNPFSFVNQQMGGGPFAGGPFAGGPFAGAGAGAFAGGFPFFG